MIACKKKKTRHIIAALNECLTLLCMKKSTTILYAGMNKSEEKRVKTLERFHQLSFCPK